MTKQDRKSYSLQPILLLSPHSWKHVIVFAGSYYSTNCSHRTMNSPVFSKHPTTGISNSSCPLRPSVTKTAHGDIYTFCIDRTCAVSGWFFWISNAALRGSYGLSARSQAGLKGCKLEVWARVLYLQPFPCNVMFKQKTGNMSAANIYWSTHIGNDTIFLNYRLFTQIIIVNK